MTGSSAGSLLPSAVTARAVEVPISFRVVRAGLSAFGSAKGWVESLPSGAVKESYGFASNAVRRDEERR